MSYASRTPAHPVLFEDDCSSALQWSAAGYGSGTVDYDTAFPHGRGTRSVKLLTAPGASNPSAYAYTLLPYLSSSFLFSFFFQFGCGLPAAGDGTGCAEMGMWTMEVSQESGSTYYDFAIRYNPQIGQWQYKSPESVWNSWGLNAFKLADSTGPDRIWHYLEIAADFNTKKFNYVRVDDAKQNLAGIPASGAGGPSNARARSHIMMWIDQRAAAATQLNIADAVVTSLSQ
jgi:hypothetical protein